MLVQLNVMYGSSCTLKKSLLFQLAVLHVASGTHGVCLNLDVQNACRDIRRRKRQGGIPLVERICLAFKHFHGGDCCLDT